MPAAAISSSVCKMAALFLRLSVLAVALCIVAGCERSPSRQAVVRPPLRPHRILVLGDSLALGFGASDASKGFIFLLYRAVQARDPAAIITSYAVGGARVDDVLHYEVPRAKHDAATDVWICVGGNDVTHATASSSFSREYRALVHTVQRHWPAARMIVFGVPDVSRSPLFTGSTRAQMRALASTDDEAMRMATQAAHVQFIDLFAFGKRVVAARDFSADNFHPSDAGYLAIADYAEPTVLRTTFR